MRQKDYYEAYIDDYDKVVVYMSKQSYDGKSDRFYMKDSKGFSIDLLIETETALYPVNVQKGDTLGKADWRSFEKLARLSGLEKPVGTGAAIGLTPRAFAVSDTAVAHGPEWIWERRLALGRARLTEDANEDASA